MLCKDYKLMTFSKVFSLKFFHSFKLNVSLDFRVYKREISFFSFTCFRFKMVSTSSFLFKRVKKKFF